MDYLIYNLPDEVNSHSAVSSLFQRHGQIRRWDISGIERGRFAQTDHQTLLSVLHFDPNRPRLALVAVNDDVLIASSTARTTSATIVESMSSAVTASSTKRRIETRSSDLAVTRREVDEAFVCIWLAMRQAINEQPTTPQDFSGQSRLRVAQKLTCSMSLAMLRGRDDPTLRFGMAMILGLRQKVKTL